MNNVADLDLCKQLYELSGWDGGEDTMYWCRNAGEELKPWNQTEMSEFSYPGFEETGIPAYDLGYLVRKLPEGTHITKAFMSGVQTRHQYNATARMSETWHTGFEADTPENAAAKLAIELFNQGVLQR